MKIFYTSDLSYLCEHHNKASHKVDVVESSVTFIVSRNSKTSESFNWLIRQTISLIMYREALDDTIEDMVDRWFDYDYSNECRLIKQASDEVIEEIYEKYKGSGKKMAPELKLFMLIIASASAFHFSKSTFKNLPGVDKILQNNPDLIAKMMNPQKESSQFMTEQEINLEKQ